MQFALVLCPIAIILLANYITHMEMTADSKKREEKSKTKVG